MRAVLALVVAVTLTGCAGRNRPAVPQPAAPPAAAKPAPAVVQGLASYYSDEFVGKITASGVPFDKKAMVAAHPTLPFGTVVRVTNLANGRRATVRIVDRGPAAWVRAEGVVIDLSYGAAAALRFLQQGRTRVRIEVVRLGK